MKKKVLFVCIHNSARTQMAEGVPEPALGHEFEAYSAGLESGRLNPVVVRAIGDVGIDISGNGTKAVDGLAAFGCSLRLDFARVRANDKAYSQ